MVESLTGLFSTLILAAGIGFLTIWGFRREAVNLKNGTCCGSESCSCGGNCSDECRHDEDLKQNPEGAKNP